MEQSQTEPTADPGVLLFLPFGEGGEFHTHVYVQKTLPPNIPSSSLVVLHAPRRPTTHVFAAAYHQPGQLKRVIPEVHPTIAELLEELECCGLKPHLPTIDIRCFVVVW